MQRAFRLIKRIFVILTLLLLLAVLVIGLASAAFNWRGVCDDIAYGERPCTWWEFARSEIFWATFLLIPFLFVAAVAYFGMSLAEFIAQFARKQKEKRAAPRRDKT